MIKSSSLCNKKVKIARTAKVEEIEEAATAKRKEIMEAATVVAAGRWSREEAVVAAKRKEIMEAETVAAAERWRMEEAAAVAAAAAAIRKRVKRKAFLENAGNQPSCALWCSHVGCSNNVHTRGVCRDHGPRCSYVGCGKNVYARGVCKTCSSPAKEPL
jgi:hypothetical protein